MTDYDLPLPSLKVKLKPGYNTGSEVYAAPENWAWKEDGVTLDAPRIIDVITPLTASVTSEVLSLGITETGDISAVAVTNPITPRSVSRFTFLVNSSVPRKFRANKYVMPAVKVS